jgi:hypothetical protein
VILLVTSKSHTEAVLSVISTVFESMPNFSVCFSQAGVKTILRPHLDSKLSCKPHINFLLHKLDTVCFRMRILSPVPNIQTLSTVYFGVTLVLCVRYSKLKKKSIKDYVEIRFMKFEQKMVKKTGDFTYLKFVYLFINAVSFLWITRITFKLTLSIHDNTRYKNELYIPLVRRLLCK